MHGFNSDSGICNLEYTFDSPDGGSGSYGVVLASADSENDTVDGVGLSSDSETSGSEDATEATESGTLTDYQNQILELAKTQVSISMITAFGLFLLLGLVLARIVWRKL